MESTLQAIWPGILGGVMTAFLIYMSLRDVTRYGSLLTVLKWRAQHRDQKPAGLRWEAPDWVVWLIALAG